MNSTTLRPILAQLILVGLLIIGTGFGSSASNIHHAKKPLELIVALGGGDERKAEAIKLSHEKFLKSTPNVKVLFTGEDDSDKMYEYWKIPQEQRVFTDRKAKSTEEDLLQTLEAVGKFQAAGSKKVKITLITTDYHVPRVKLWAHYYLSEKNKLHYSLIGVKGPADPEGKLAKHELENLPEAMARIKLLRWLDQTGR